MFSYVSWLFIQEYGPNNAHPARDWKPSLWYVCSFNGNLHIGTKIGVSEHFGLDSEC